MGFKGSRRKTKQIKKKGPKGLSAEAAQSALDEIDRTLRPSELLRKKLQSQIKFNRPECQPEPTNLLRIYRKTIQRVPLTHLSLFSYAAFILVCDTTRTLFLWFGSSVTDEDSRYAKEIAMRMKTAEYGDYGPPIIEILEDMEPTDALNFFVDQLFTTNMIYRSKLCSNQRKNKGKVRKIFLNSTVRVYTVEKIFTSYHPTLFSQAKPSETDGSVDRVSFPPLSPSSIVLVRVGDQSYLWVARGVRAEEVGRVKEHLINYIALEGSDEFTSTLDAVMASGYITVVPQGCERLVFRVLFKHLTDFEPEGLTLPYVPAVPDPDKESITPTLDEPLVEDEELPTILVTSFMQSTFSPINAAVEESAGYVRDLFSFVNFEAPTQSSATSSNSFEAQSKVRFDEPLSEDKARHPHPPTLRGPDLLVETKSGHWEPAKDSSEASGGAVRVSEDEALLGPELSGPELGGVCSETDPRMEGSLLLSATMFQAQGSSSAWAEGSSSSEKELALNLSVSDPKALIGWKIDVVDGMYKGEYVVTGTKKQLFRPTLFRLSYPLYPDLWIKLRRGDGKAGERFVLVEKILDPFSLQPLSPSISSDFHPSPLIQV